MDFDHQQAFIMKRLIIISMVFVGLFFGCKKYEDGPLISLRSPTKRLYGNYTLKTYTVNGFDSLSLYNDSLSLSFSFFYDDVDYKNLCCIVGRRKDGNYSELYWSWRLINGNEVLQIYRSVGIIVGTGPFGTDKFPEWKILLLTNKKVKMKTTYNEKEYLIELKQE
jgi:hypothetical protein